jgi:hypothetical protein
VELAPLAVSVLALATSIFTFWWTTIRTTQALYLVRIDKLGHFGGFNFALINAGKNDLLLTTVAAYFEGTGQSSYFYPAARIIAEGATSDLLAAGKAVEYRIEFPEPFSPSFAQTGKKQQPWPQLHSHYLGIEVSWVEMNGVVHSARVLHSTVGFEPDGKQRAIAPATTKNVRYNLNAAAA